MSLIPNFNAQPMQSMFDPKAASALNLGGGGWGNAGQYSMGGAGGFQQPGADMSSLLGDYGMSSFLGDYSMFKRPTVAPDGKNLFSSFLQNKDADGSTSGGYGMAGLQLANGFYNMYSGRRKDKRADEMADFAKEDSNRRWNAQKSDTNRQLSDRQDMRRIDNPNGNHMETSAYMDKWGIK